ncbi:MAG TPA: TatD family hydrolase [Bacteroidales bacterium]|nr:TatD family hydrolase [Bacteroidales bacterium]
MDQTLYYIDIHAHTWYTTPGTRVVLNVFPYQAENMSLPCSKSVGLHPWHLSESTCKDQLKTVEHLSKSADVIAIGETGLDKAIEVNYDLQKEVFASHLKLAKAVKKPVIIHCVRSYSEMLAYRKSFDPKIPWIFHWFNADISIARQLMKKNCYLSFGHMLFNERSKAFRLFQQIPPENLFFETDDAGYSIQDVYARAASLRNTTVTDLQKQIMDNFVRCFHTL